MPTLDKEQEKLLEQWDKAPLDAAALKLINASRNSLLYLHRAAKMPRCDWGLDYDDGIMLLLPHLGKARDLARLAALHARHEFDQGHWQAGIDDAKAIMVLGRHAGRDRTLISLLVRCLIEGITVDLVAPYVPELKAAPAKVTSMPAALSLPQIIVLEKKYMAGWVIKKLKAADQQKKGSWRQLWKEMLAMSEISDPIENVETVEEAAKMMENVLPVYDELAKMAALPKDEFDAQYPEFKRRSKAANPVAGTLLPAIDLVLAKERRHHARMAMLLAAIAVAQEGPDKLKDIKDPFGAGPFEYRALDSGFELKSKLLFEDKPVTLTIGQKAKK
jgi:hypothetical protein